MRGCGMMAVEVFNVSSKGNRNSSSHFTGIRLPLALRDELDEYCKASGHTLTEVVIMALRWYLDLGKEGGAGED